ncbi:unnamed protein product [Trichogramma brassicae]|uniref:Integrase zinc-binding domain-containing protein n=1 Tax=Trichogramma brassicae TaxID=86971 RepID=A0A6H5I6V7_9HYME|nr:unnamed protein product [Trichogramma brassicae]
MEHHRDHSGRYVVRLPLKPDAGRLLSSSESSACASLAHLHRRMARDAIFAAAYRGFMQAYIDSGHMIRLSYEERTLRDRPVHYIPHHGIWQHDDHKPRLRVVFDELRPTSSGVSLNDITRRVFKLQRDIWTILLRWRRHRVAFCADMKMMYRQIWIDERNLDWQHVVWSPNSSDPVQHFRLLTVIHTWHLARSSNCARTKAPNSPLPRSPFYGTDGSSHLATLVIDWAHARSIHGGFKATYVKVFQCAWLINERRRIRHHVSQCMICVAA